MANNDYLFTLDGSGGTSGFEVRVDEMNESDLLFDGDGGSLFDDLGSNLDFGLFPDGMTAEGAPSSSTSEDSSSSSSSSKKKKRDRRDLEIFPTQVCLPKAVELEVSSVEDFEDYMQRLSASRVLNGNELSDLQQQRKRIRNRLYALQKRQKERETKSAESQLVQELRAEVTRLRHENAMLMDENKRLGGSVHLSLSRSKMSLFAVLLSVSFLVSPLSPFWAKSQSFDTGRSLMSVSSQTQTTGAASWVGSFWLSSRCPVRPMSEGSCAKVHRNDTAVIWKCKSVYGEEL